MSYISDQDRWESPFKDHATPCNRCRLSDCNSLHDYVATDCPLGGCDMCSDLAELDAQITSVHDQLIALVRKRWATKSKINTRHDKMNRQLPTELVSHIFNLIVTSSTNAATTRPIWGRPWLRAPLALGVVCKGWRDITLGTPQLWTSLVINPWTHSTDLNPTREWLRRSGAVPLSLTIHADEPWGVGPRTFAPLVDLLRSHAGRWKHVILSGPWYFYRDLFNDLQDAPPIDTFDVTVDLHSGTVPIHMYEPIRPREFISWVFPIDQMPLQWDNLTRLNITSMPVDQILHILAQGNGILDCTVQNVTEYSGKYPLPTGPITRYALNHLKIGRTTEFGSNLLPYLVLPSLKTLDYQFPHDLAALDILVAFLDRSRAFLETFTFKDSFDDVLIPWYEHVSSITHLDIRIFGFNDTLPVTEDFFRALSRTTGPLILPHLRGLQLSTQWMPQSFWPLFCDIFKDTHEEPASSEEDVPADHVDSNITDRTDAITHVTTPPANRHKRPLDSVHIRYSGGNWNPMMDESTLNKVLDIQKSGVALEVVDGDGKDVLVNASRIFTFQQLPFGFHLPDENETTQWSGSFTP